jgi:predicted permease
LISAGEPRLGGRLIDVALAAYPRDHRDRFGAGMRYAFAQDLSRAHSRGRFATALFWLTVLLQIVTHGFAERIRRVVDRSRRFFMRGLLPDCRDALRSLRTARFTALAAILSLGLGIGATTALFTILDSLVFKTLPIQDPHRLIRIEPGSWTYPIWKEIDARASLFDGAFAWANRRFDLARGGESDFVDGAYVSGRAFEVLGVRALMGRTLDERDDVRGGGEAGPVAVISYRHWQQRFGARPDIVGQSLTVQHVPVTIVGVMSPEFFGPDVGRTADVIVPFGIEPLIAGTSSALERRTTWWLEIYARLQDQQTVDAANAALRGVQPQIREATIPTHWSADDQAQYLKDPLAFVSAATGRSPLRDRYQRPLTILLAAVGLVLVIACANIASLLIARALSRRHELTVRLALGASRWRLGRQLLVESALIAVAGAALGLGIAHWASRALVSQLSTPQSQTSLDLAVDWRVLLFAVGVAVVTALIFGVAPAATVSRLSAQDALTTRGSVAGAERRTSVRHLLVVTQVALSVTLVVGAALFARTFWALSTTPLGVDADRVLIVNVDPRRAAASDEGRMLVVETLREAAASTPGVAIAAAAFMTPASGSSWNTEVVLSDGVTPSGGQEYPWINSVSPGYFAAVGTPILSGRDFAPTDVAGAPRVVIVNETFAREFLEPGPPIGQRVRERDDNEFIDRTVIGVVRDSVYQSLRSGTQAIMFLARTQEDPMLGEQIVVRAAEGVEPAALARSVSAALTAASPATALTTTTLSSQLARSLVRERLVAVLSLALAVLAIVLAAIGLFGVTAHGVARRRGEIAIRMALGAKPGGVIGLVVRRAAWTVLAGLVAGAALTWWATEYVATLLHQVEPRDPATFAVAAVALLVVAAVAAWLPARRAARIDPLAALRQ